MKQRSSQEHKKKLLAVVVVLIVIIAASGLLVFSKAHSAQVEIEVTSVHFTQNIDVDIYIDGKYLTTWYGITPGSTWYSQYYQVVKFPLWDEAKIVTVTAISYGGGLGQFSDSQTITVHSGGKYTVHVYV